MNHQIDHHAFSLWASALWRHLLRIMGLLAATLALTGCSALKLGYNTLPDLSYWWLDGYADFNDEQAPRVREELRRVQAWHRVNELPKVADLLEKLEAMAPNPITGPQACAVAGDALARAFALADRAEPSVVAVASTFNARQLRHIERKFGKKNAEWRKDWVEAPPEERHEKRLKQWTDRLESLYGPMEEPQRVVLRRAIAQSAWDPARQLTEWQRRQADLLQMLKLWQDRGIDAGQARAALHAWTERVLRSPDAGYRKYQQDLLDENCRTFAAVHESTSVDQRARAVRRLKAWQRDLRELAAQQ